MDFCQESFVYFNSFISHIKSHIKYGIKIACPYENCNRQYSIVSSFSSHLYRVHGYDVKCERLVLHPVHNMRSVANAEQSSVISDITVRPTRSNSSISNFTSTLHCDISVHGYLENGSSISPGTSNTDNDATMISLICLVQHKYLVPLSTIKVIISETAAVLGNFTTQTKDKIKSLLELHLVDQSLQIDIMTQLSKDLHTKNSFDRFSTEYSRREYIKNNLAFAPPIPKLLSLPSELGEYVTYMYVPLLQNLKALFTDATVKQQFLSVYQQTNLFRDFCDGLKVENNPMFNSNDQTLKIVLYSDAFEVVNPLGSTKKKHKVFVCITLLQIFMITIALRLIQFNCCYFALISM